MLEKLFFNITFIVFLLSCTPCSSGQGSKAVVELTHYKNGKPNKVERNTDEIASRLEWIFTNADDSCLLAVDEELIKSIKKEGAVELAYAIPKTLKAGFLSKDIPVSNLLIPIAGHFADPAATVFYADPAYGAFNVLVKKNGLPAINKIKDLLRD